MSTPVVLTCAVNGGEPSDNPHIPADLDAIVEESVAALEAGASVVHLHARDGDGALTQDPDVYRAIGDSIRERRPDAVLNFSTGGTVGMSDEERARVLGADPDLASVACGSMNFGAEQMFLNDPAFIRSILREMRRRGVRPELECFELGMVGAVAELVDEGLVEDPVFVQFCLGFPGGAPGDVATIARFASALPKGTQWAAVVPGPGHLAALATTLALGGHVRTGFEDLDRLPDGSWVRSNVELVERALAIIHALGLRVATPDEARGLLGLRALEGAAR